MTAARFITALCTPLTNDEELHASGLEAHIHDQITNDIDGLLVAGTMGAMQLLTEATYLDLVRSSIKFNQGKSELLVGVGDTSYVRTRDRIRMIDNLEFDGVVILSPFFFKFRQDELIQYFESLADESSKPVFLYDLPGTTGTKLEIPTVLKLLEHPNIRGIKCSDQFTATRPLLDTVLPPSRVIVAQPLLVDVLLRSGVSEHLDGVFGLVPHWIKQMKQASQVQDWDQLASIQRDLSELLKVLLSLPVPVLSASLELLRLRGIPGDTVPAPMKCMTADQREEFKLIPIIQKAIST